MMTKQDLFKKKPNLETRLWSYMPAIIWGIVILFMVAIFLGFVWLQAPVANGHETRLI